MNGQLNVIGMSIRELSLTQGGIDSEEGCVRPTMPDFKNYHELVCLMGEEYAQYMSMLGGFGLNG